MLHDHHTCLLSCFTAFEKYGGEKLQQTPKEHNYPSLGPYKMKGIVQLEVWFPVFLCRHALCASSPLGKLGFQDLGIRGEKWSHGHNRGKNVP